MILDAADKAVTACSENIIPISMVLLGPSQPRFHFDRGLYICWSPASGWDERFSSGARLPGSRSGLC